MTYFIVVIASLKRDAIMFELLIANLTLNSKHSMQRDSQTFVQNWIIGEIGLYHDDHKESMLVWTPWCVFSFMDVRFLLEYFL